MNLGNCNTDILYERKNFQNQNYYKQAVSNISEAYAYVEWIKPFGKLYFVFNFEQSRALGKNGGIMSCSTNSSNIILNVLNVEGRLHPYIANFIETFGNKDLNIIKSISISAIVYIEDKNIKAGPIINSEDEEYNLKLDLNFENSACEVLSENNDISYLSFKYSDIEDMSDLISPILMYIGFFKSDINGDICNIKDNIKMICENEKSGEMREYVDNKMEIRLKNYADEKVGVILDCINIQSMIRNKKYSSKCESHFLFNNERNDNKMINDDDICHFLLKANGDSIDYKNSDYYKYREISEVKMNNNNLIEFFINNENVEMIKIKSEIYPSILYDLLYENQFEISINNNNNKLSKENKMILLSKLKENVIFVLYGLQEESENYNESNNSVMCKCDNLGKYVIESHLHLLKYKVNKLRNNNNCIDNKINENKSKRSRIDVKYSEYILKIDKNEKMNESNTDNINDKNNEEKEE